MFNKAIVYYLCLPRVVNIPIFKQIPLQGTRLGKKVNLIESIAINSNDKKTR